MTITASHVLPTTDTTVVTWEIDIATADAVIQVLQEVVAHHLAIGTPIPEHVLNVCHHAPALQEALDTALTAAISETIGCDVDSATTVTLTEPALMGTVGTDNISILIPGAPCPGTATVLAVQMLRDLHHEHGFVLDERTLTAVVHEPEYWVFYGCESVDHSFHPTLADDGPATPGAQYATLVTFVDD